MGGGGSANVCEYCGRKDDDHDNECEVFDQPKKCADCGAEMQLIEQYNVEWVQEVYTWDAEKKQWKHKEQITSNLDPMPDEKFFSCPNYDSDEECCMIEGVAYSDGKPLSDHEV